MTIFCFATVVLYEGIVTTGNKFMNNWLAIHSRGAFRYLLFAVKDNACKIETLSAIFLQTKMVVQVNEFALFLTLKWYSSYFR